MKFKKINYVKYSTARFNYFYTLTAYYSEYNSCVLLILIYKTLKYLRKLGDNLHLTYIQ